MESSRQGTDEVMASVSYKLANNVENMTLTGDANINGTGNSSNNVLTGNAGDNILRGGSGNDKLYGEDGNDTLHGEGGNDSLYGGAGDDALYGGCGSDRLFGDIGHDVMSGGAGSDTFVFTSLTDSGATAETRDVITDFRTWSDRIDLSGIDAKADTTANDAFVFIKSLPFSNTAGELHFERFDVAGKTDDYTLVSADVNGDGIADFQIELSGLIKLTAKDFVL